MKRVLGQRMVSALVLVFALNATASGQVRRSEIAGTIKDDTEGALPGVTITATSPSLQVPSVVRVSDERGGYRLPELLPGTYRVTYELPGFASLIREGIVLTTGFAARLDIEMKVATLAETITVSGVSPVVDVTTTRGGGTVSAEMIATIPGNNNFRDVIMMVGGQRTTTAPNTGGMTAEALGFAGQSYGAGTGQAVAEGMKRYGPSPANFSAYEEVDVKTFGNTADVDQPGALVQMIVKSGGNQFHGRYNEIFQHESLQSTNLDDRLRADGLTTGNSIVYFTDFTGDLGGRIVRDKLWFYANTRLADNKFTSTGFVQNAGTDGVYNTGDEPTAYPKDRFRSGVVKVSYQANAQHRFVGLFHDTNNHYFQYFSRYVPMESSARHNQLGRDYKPFDWQGMLKNNWLVNMMWGAATFRTYRYFNGPEGATNPSGGWVAGSGVPNRFDRTTQQVTGPAWDVNVLGTSDNPQHQVRGSMSYLPTGTFLGSHNLQTGYMLYFSKWYRAFPGGILEGCKIGRTVCPGNQGIGEYRLTYDTVGGVPHQGVEIDIKNFPVEGHVGKNMYAWYFMDSWRPTNRLTLNLGLRWERKVNWAPEQSKQPSTPAGFIESVGEPFNRRRTEAGTWNVWAPRAGAAFDLTGDGTTVVKASYGWFNEDLAIDYADAFSQNEPVNYTFRWNDRNRDGNYQPGEVNLALNGADFLSVSGATNNRVNPDLRLPHTHEATGSIEHQLSTGLAVRGLFVYKRLVDVFQATNVLRPLGVWNQPFTRTDLGPDGVLRTADDGPSYTIYDYDPAYRGAAFVSNMNQNATEADTYKSFEVMLTKRASEAGWFANTSFLATKAHVWRTKGVMTTPNDSLFPEADYWDLTYLAAGGYNFPHGILVSTLFQAYNGLTRQRTVQFRAADPAGGARFPSSSTITLPMEAAGATRGPTRQILNLRVAKNFNLSGSRAMTASLDAFNALNTNAAWGRNVAGISDVSGPTYGDVTAFVGPRNLRVNVGFEF